MNALRKVRTNNRIFELMEGDSSRYWAGYYIARRDHNMDLARRMRKTNPAISKLFVDFARDDHRKFLGHLKRIRSERSLKERMADYQQMAISRVLGAMQ